MARRESVTDRNDTSVKARNRRRRDEEAEKVVLPAMATKVALPEKFRTERGGVGSTMARVRESRPVRRAESRLAARIAGTPDKRGFHKPGSQKFR